MFGDSFLVVPKKLNPIWVLSNRPPTLVKSVDIKEIK